jgi:SnoaL-like protein
MKAGKMKKIGPEAVVRQYIDAKDNHRWNEVVSLLDPEFTSTDPAIPEPVKGIEAVSQFFPMLEHVYMQTEILMMASKGEDVAAELAVTCTFEKPSDSAATLPTSPSIVVKMAKFYKVNSNGLLMDEREYSNPAAKSALLGSEAAAQFQALGEEAATHFEVPGQPPTGQ